MKLIGRKKETRKIGNYATSEPENKAFFGVKGLGKSVLFENAFSKANCKLYADEYQYLFVRTILQPEKKGEDLVNFLLDRVINGISLIDDELLRDDIHEKIKASEDKYHSKDSLLREALECIRDNDYTMILIMDEFHNMGRNSAVGSEQYDFLRSLNELGLLYYWIISDSDFSDVYATSQFTTSFFAQKFIPETIPQMVKDDVVELIRQNAEKFEIDIPDDVVEKIYSIIGGIPGFVAPAVTSIETLGLSEFDEEKFTGYLIENPKCLSLLTSWSRSLTSEQKDLLKEISLAGKVYQTDYMGIIGKINQLGDHSGLGLLIHGDDENGRFWKINSKLFSYFIENKGDSFYSAEIVPAEKKEEVQTNPTYIQNNYYTVNNNFFNPSSAVEAMLNLKKLVGSQQQILLPDIHLMTSAVQQLPYQQSGWDDMDDEEKDEKMIEYADGIFSSGDFRADSLSETQMQRFFLNQSILDNLTETSRNNLISAIQVYDLLQFCVDKFGLNMLNSESARGILFARLYESILKENLSPALNSVDEIADKEIVIDRTTYRVGDAPSSKMTIGNFVYILNSRDVQQRLASICLMDIQKSSCDNQWWRNHQTDMYNIGVLRNDCCHSGNYFDAPKLEKLLKYLFELQAIADVEIYNEITNRT